MALDALRIAKQLTEADVAELLDVPRSPIDGLEQGHPGIFKPC